MKSNQKLSIARGFLVTILTIGLSLISAHWLVGQSPEPQKPKTEAEQLKDRLQALEQTVIELKGQLAALEEAKKSPKPAIIEATYIPPPVSTGNAAANPKPDDVDKTTFQIYGFAMLDAGYDFKTNHPDWFDTVRPTKLPSFAGEFAPNGKTYMGVRQSRLGVKSSTPTKFGELKTTFEFELFGTGGEAGKTIFRLRHAYGELGKFGAGQYWTVFGDTDAYPNTFEYWGPNGLVWFRNVQFRWMPLQGKNSVTIGLERPGAGADLGNYADRIELQGVKPRLPLPDLTGHVRFDRDWGHLQISGIVRSIKWVDTNTKDAVDLSGSAVGFGGSASSHLNIGKNNVARLQFTYGKGIENYMNDAPVDIGVRITPQVNPLGSTSAPSGTSPAGFEGVALPVFGMSTFLDHTWNERFTSSFGYSMLNIENSNGQANNAFHRGHYGIANLLYYPVKNVAIGGEFQWGRRENFLDGFRSDDFRIQFGFKYNFAKEFKFQ